MQSCVKKQSGFINLDEQPTFFDDLPLASLHFAAAFHPTDLRPASPACSRQAIFPISF